MYLNDEVEIDLLGQLTAMLRQKRAADAQRSIYTSEPLTKAAAQGYSEAGTPQTPAEAARVEIAAAPVEKSPVVEGTTPEQEDDRPGEPYVPEKSPVVGSITPAVPAPSESEAADALRAYIGSKGVEAAVKLLGEFGVKRAGELAPEQRAAFIGKTKETCK